VTFDRVRAKVLAKLRSDERDPTVVRLQRINELGLLTFDTQTGKAHEAYKQRSYCFGFVRDRERAVQLTEWVSLNTDKYASLVVVQGDGRPDPHNRFVASAADVMLRKTAGCFPVGVKVIGSAEEVYSTVSPFTIPAYRHVAGAKEDPVPSDACVTFADLVWGRAADAKDGLFTAIERGLAELNAAEKNTTKRRAR
jgi:hypothetical protein